MYLVELVKLKFRCVAKAFRDCDCWRAGSTMVEFAVLMSMQSGCRLVIMCLLSVYCVQKSLRLEESASRFLKKAEKVKKKKKIKVKTKIDNVFADMENTFNGLSAMIVSVPPFAALEVCTRARADYVCVHVLPFDDACRLLRITAHVHVRCVTHDVTT